MNSMLTIDQLTREIDRQETAKQDIIAPIESVAFIGEKNGEAGLIVSGFGEFAITEHGHSQLAGYCGIPREYYRRCLRDDPTLLQQQVNHWLERKGDDKRLIRTLDGNVRAICSPSYRILDHRSALDALLPAFDRLGLEIVACGLTEEHMTIKAVSPSRMRPVGERSLNDIVQYGVSGFNSETRDGVAGWEQMLYRLKCTNGMVVGETGGMFSRRHAGPRYGGGLNAPVEYEPDKEQRKRDDRLWETFGRSIEGGLTDEKFLALIDRLDATTTQQASGEPEKVVHALARRLSLRENEEKIVLANLQREWLGGTRWAYVNAITATANNIGSFSRAQEIEAMGWDVVSMDDMTWDLISRRN